MSEVVITEYYNSDFYVTRLKVDVYQNSDTTNVDFKSFLKAAFKEDYSVVMAQNRSDSGKDLIFANEMNYSFDNRFLVSSIDLNTENYRVISTKSPLRGSNHFDLNYRVYPRESASIFGVALFCISNAQFTVMIPINKQVSK